MPIRTSPHKQTSLGAVADGDMVATSYGTNSILLLLFVEASLVGSCISIGVAWLWLLGNQQTAQQLIPAVARVTMNYCLTTLPARLRARVFATTPCHHALELHNGATSLQQRRAPRPATEHRRQTIPHSQRETAEQQDLPTSMADGTPGHVARSRKYRSPWTVVALWGMRIECPHMLR